MNRHELLGKLQEIGIPEKSYSINQGTRAGRYCLESYTNKWGIERWKVYYSEMGEEVGLHEFDTESDACEYFLSTIDYDVGRRIRRAKGNI